MAVKVFGAFALAAALLVSSNVVGTGGLPQDDKEPGKKPMDPAEMAKIMALYEKAAVPGPQHKMLAGLEGTWDMKFAGMMGSFSGQVHYHAIMGGRFVVAQIAAMLTMPGPDGKPQEMPWEAYQILGYDNVLKQYQAVWLDSMGTGIYVSPGTADATGKIISFEAPMKDAFTPQGRPYKIVINFEGEDRHVTELWDAKDGKTLVKEGTVTETRKKK
jgi:hypothetical protein